MKKLTPDFYVHAAESLHRSLTGGEVENIHYMVLADSDVPWNNITTEPNLSPQNLGYDEKNKFIAAKRIMSSDTVRMVKGNFFTAGQVYDMYDNAVDMTDKRFFIAVDEPSGSFTVWKCLYNNNGLPARRKPTYSSTSEAERLQITSDGYMWKFMYRIAQADALKFRSGDWIPVRENENVKAAAINGSIDIIRVKESGANYNSYSYGYFKQAQVAGDPLIYSLSTSENINTILYTINISNGSFILDASRPVYVGSATQVAGNGILTNDVTRAYKLSVHDTDGTSYVSILAPVEVNLPQLTHIYQFTNESSAYINSTENGQPIRLVQLNNASASANITSTRYRYIPTLSANTDFYKNSSIYIRSGQGAGQLRTVAEYVVTGNERRVVLDKPFDVVPNINTTFEILPRIIITGDGTSSDGTGQATAIPVIDNASNSIVSIQMIDPGKNYTYASAVAVANTGYIDIVTGNPISSDAAVIAPIIAPLGGHGANVYAELNSTAVCISKQFSNTEGGLISIGNDFGKVMLVKGLQASNTELTITSNAFLFRDEERVIQDDGMAKAIVSNRDGNTLRLSHIQGQFEAGRTISTLRETSNVTTTISSVDRSIDILNGMKRFAVEIQSTGFDGQGFRPDDEVFQSNAGLDNANARGKIFIAATDLITITESRGVWNVSDDISGTVSTIENIRNGAVAKITGLVHSDIQAHTGTIQHIETLTPVTRAANQNETLRIVISTKDGN